MKKITLFIFLLISSMGFSQNLITNGDFENGSTDWAFSSPGVVLNGEAYFSTANAGGDPWSTELKQTGKSFIGGNTYTLTFRARAAANRNISVNIQNTNVWTNDQFRNDAVALTTTMTTYSYDFVSTVTNTNAQLNFHMANMGTNTTAAVYIDDVTLTLKSTSTCNNGVQDGTETGVDCGGSCAPCPVPPATAAPIQPARAIADVLSVFSDEYTNVVPSGVLAFGAAAAYTNYTIANTNDTRRLTVTANGSGVQYEYINVPPLDLTNFTTMHIDFYIEGAVQPGQELQIFLVNFGSWPSGAGSTKLFKNFDVNAIGSGAWYSADIALNTFNDNLTRDKISLVQIVVNGGAGSPAFSPVYIDNIYFHKNTTLATKKFEIAGLNAYPNPARDSWTVTTNNTNMSTIEVFDILGKNVLSLKPNASEAKINASGLKTGVYFAKINTINGSSTLKLVKE